MRMSTCETGCWGCRTHADWASPVPALCNCTSCVCWSAMHHCHWGSLLALGLFVKMGANALGCRCGWCCCNTCLGALCDKAHQADKIVEQKCIASVVRLAAPSPCFCNAHGPKWQPAAFHDACPVGNLCMHDAAGVFGHAEACDVTPKLLNHTQQPNRR